VKPPRCHECAAFTERPDLGTREDRGVSYVPWGDCGQGRGGKPTPAAACQHLEGMVHRLGEACDGFDDGQRGLFGDRATIRIIKDGAPREVADGMAGVIERAKGSGRGSS